MPVEYITLADGRRISTSTGLSVDNTRLGPEGRPPLDRVPMSTAEPTSPSIVPSTSSEPFTPAHVRTIADLPEEGKRANVVALAVALQLFGLSDDEIAMQMRAEVEAVRGLLISKAASDFRDAVVDGVSRRYEPAVRKILNEASVDAAKELVASVRRGHPSSRLKAAASVLDRTGHSAVNNVEHKVNGGLIIEVVQRGTRVPDIVVEGI